MRRRPRPPSRAGGSTAAMWRWSSRTATSRSRTAARTSSSPAGKTFPRSRSRTCSTVIRPSWRLPSSRSPTSAGAKRPAPSSNSSPMPRSASKTSWPIARPIWPATRFRAMSCSASCPRLPPGRSRNSNCASGPRNPPEVRGMSEAYRCSDARAGRGARARLSPHALLSPQQMGSADRAAPAAGVPGVRLMEAAGAAVARAVQERWAPTRVLGLCGPGNNGGAGFVAARLLRDAGWPVRVALWGSRDALHGDAAWAADSWGGPVEPAVPGSLDGAGLIVDALLGAGLSRAPADELQALIDAVNAAAVPVCAIDVPTGLDGASGRCPGAAIRADLTVTFCRRKPDAALEPIVPEAYANHPGLWSEAFPWPRSDGHKSHRGHVLAVGGERMTGASRLACLAAARIGAGLVTLAVPPAAWAIQAGALASVMVEALPPDGALARALADPRRNALLIGPGLGREPRGKSQVLELLASGRPCLLDADALSVFSGQPDALLQALHAQCVLTPHEGEFARLFGPVTDGAGGGKLRRARDAARR